MSNSDDFATIVDLVRHRAEQQPEQIAFTYLDESGQGEANLTFAQLDREARTIAAVLQKQTQPGDRALLLYRNDLHFVSAFLGCLYAGVIAIPACIYETLTHMCRNFAIFTDSTPRVVMATASYLDTICQIKEDGPKSLQSFSLVATDDLHRKLADEWIKPELDGSHIAFLQYTSGSTDEPKGVIVTHANILSNQKMIQLGFGHTSESVMVGWLPLFHDMGLIGHVLQPIFLGCRSVLLSPTCFLQRPIRWLEAVQRYAGTTIGGPNFAYDRCVDRIKPEQRDKLDLSSLQVAYNGSEPVRESTLNRFADYFAPCGFRRQSFLPCYGLAEATLFVTGCSWQAEPVVRQLRKPDLEQRRIVISEDGEESQALVGCGASQLDARVVIVDPETHTPLSPGRMGEIWVSGENVAHGYFGRPEKSRETFNAHLAETADGPFLRTGDLGFIETGQLFVAGRMKDLIIVYGRNFYPQELERSAEDAHPGFQPGGACAFGVPIGGEEKLVIVQSVQRRALRDNFDQMVELIRQNVADEHQVSVFGVGLVQSGRVPKTSSGKTQRQFCRRMWMSGELELLHHWSLRQTGNSN